MNNPTPVPSNSLLARIETWLRDKSKGQQYGCVRGYRYGEAQRNCEGCLLMDAKAEIERLQRERDERADWAAKWHRGLETIAVILEVPSQGSDEMLTRDIAAAIEKLRASNEPPAGCAQCSNVAPIAKLTVRDGLAVRAGLYAPGLPDGDHDVYPSASSQPPPAAPLATTRLLGNIDEYLSRSPGEAIHAGSIFHQQIKGELQRLRITKGEG